jgi:hypothetical protein
MVHQVGFNTRKFNYQLNSLNSFLQRITTCVEKQTQLTKQPTNQLTKCLFM